MDYDKVLQLLRELHTHEVEYVLVGGMALNLLGLVRPTDDVDLFVRPTEENIARLRNALRAVWDDPAIEEIAAAELAGDIPVVRYGPPDSDLVVDVISGSSRKSVIPSQHNPRPGVVRQPAALEDLELEVLGVAIAPRLEAQRRDLAVA